ncbi:hypothetical protein [Oceaniglobus ichthyenteri]|uniref:hypothetical protein n=1 Tax=Oceaniglobus ichthyenteri TaxID=2136177 RepID=UPI000D3A9E7E|nr:hypothetical protein [Oceaniglobus ichthyenteri]
MALPPRVFFTLHEASARWGCNIADIAGWADAGRIRILSGIPPVCCGAEIIAGKVVLSPMELLPLFRRCGTGPSEGVMRRIQPLVGHDWMLITDPAGGIPVAVADMMILWLRGFMLLRMKTIWFGAWRLGLARQHPMTGRG